MSRTIGFVEAAAALAVAAVSETELKNELVVEYDEDETTTEPLPEITEDPVTTESVAEPETSDAVTPDSEAEDCPEYDNDHTEPPAGACPPEKPKRGRKKAEVSDESDSDG